MSDNDKDLELGELGDLELGGAGELSNTPLEADAGLEFSLEEDNLDTPPSPPAEPAADIGELSLVKDFSADLPTEADLTTTEVKLEDEGGVDFSLDDEAVPDISLDPSGDAPSASDGLSLSDDALTKLKEIDEMMLADASSPKIDLGQALEKSGPAPVKPSKAEVKDDLDLVGGDLSLDSSLVGDDLDLSNLSSVQEQVGAEEVIEAAPKGKTKKTSVEDRVESIKEISQGYSAEMERLAATIANLRADREELEKKLDQAEREKMEQSRQLLGAKAELDEKKIELSIIRKRLHQEIDELKDKNLIFEEKKQLWDERFKQLTEELERERAKNKLDIKRSTQHERELEQRLELLKVDSETQIRHRDQKILELKRKLDTMEFDMEHMNHHEQKHQETRVELENKLDKAIRTLRNAISMLETDDEHAVVIEKLKKNIEV